MAIATDSVIVFHGTQDVADDTSTSTIADGAYSVAADVSTWTNDDDAPLGQAVLECQFDTTMPTVGNIGLFARCLNVVSTSDPEVPSDNYPHIFVGTFPIPFGVANDVNFFTIIPLFQIPGFLTSQTIDWYLKNNGTGQTIGVDWNLWITPLTHGPHG